jgi:hypothetical protein
VKGVFDISEVITEIEEIKSECISYHDKVKCLLEGGESPKAIVETMCVEAKILELTSALVEGRSLRLTAISKLEDACDIEVASMRLEVVFEDTINMLREIKKQVAHEI